MFSIALDVVADTGRAYHFESVSDDRQTKCDEGIGILELTRDLCSFRTSIVAEENAAFFERLGREVPLRIQRYPSGEKHMGWEVPRLWRVRRAEIRRDGEILFDGTSHVLGVAAYSKSFAGEISWEELKAHLVTVPAQPEAILYHAIWLYRPWDADWALSVPHRVYETLGPGRYEVRLETTFEAGEMLLGDFEHRGSSDRTIVFQAHNCHPGMANDGMAGVAVLTRLFQWLATRTTRYTYRLLVAPEHVGTVFYLRDRPREEIERIAGGVFTEMPSTGGGIVASTTLFGGHPIDAALANAVRAHPRGWRITGFRGGVGNDETVWEAPGHEVPFAQLSCTLGQPGHFPEYHTNLDTPDRLDPTDLAAFLDVLKRFVDILERNASFERTFDGFPCLSSPDYRLYYERFDPAIEKNLAPDADAWGHMSDALYRLFDGTTTCLDIAERFGLPFGPLRDYLARFEEKGLVVSRPVDLPRRPISRRADAAAR